MIITHGNTKIELTIKELSYLQTIADYFIIEIKSHEESNQGLVDFANQLNNMINGLTK